MNFSCELGLGQICVVVFKFSPSSVVYKIGIVICNYSGLDSAEQNEFPILTDQPQSLLSLSAIIESRINQRSSRAKPKADQASSHVWSCNRRPHLLLGRRAGQDLSLHFRRHRNRRLYRRFSPRRRLVTLPHSLSLSDD